MTDLNGKAPVSRFRTIVSEVASSPGTMLASVERRSTPALKAASMMASNEAMPTVGRSGTGMR